MASVKNRWGWPWWLLAFVLVGVAVFVVHQVLQWRQERLTVKPVVLENTESLAAGRHWREVLLNDNYRYYHPVSLADDSPERMFPASWGGKVLTATVELEIPAGKSGGVHFIEFDEVQQNVNGAWVVIKPRGRWGQAFTFDADLRPGKHSFRTRFRTCSPVCMNPYLALSHDAEKGRSLTYRIEVKPVE